MNDLRAALVNLLEHYLSIANSGDCGFWDPEEETVVINARVAILESEKASKDLQHLLNCVNSVTVFHRHGMGVPNRKMANLCNAQLDYEKSVELSGGVK